MPTYSTAFASALSGTVSGTWSAYNTGTAQAMASAVTYLSDALDTTYISPTALGPDDTAGVYFTMNAPSIGSGSAISVIRIGVRAGFSGNYARAYLTSSDGGTVLSDSSWYGSSIAVGGYTGGWANSPSAGSAWTSSELTGLLGYVVSTDTVNRDAQLYIEAKQVSLPFGTPTVTSQTTNWSYGDADGFIQSSAVVKYFASAVYSAGGFDPDTSTAMFSSVVAGTTRTVTPSTVIPNGYMKPYIRVISDKDGAAIFGTWTPSVLAYNISSAPVVPATLAGTYLTDYRRNRITITGTSYTVTINRDGTQVGSAYRAAGTIYDYLGTRGGTATYIVDYYSGTTKVDSGTVTVVASTATTWEMQSINNPTTIYDFDVKVTAQDFTQFEGVNVNRTLSSSYPIVLAGELYGEDGTLQVMTTTAQEWDDLTELTDVQGPLILTSPFLNSDGTNKKWLIRITDRSWSAANTVATPINRATLSYVEVNPVGY
jgi:hypothetical protein